MQEPSPESPPTETVRRTVRFEDSAAALSNVIETDSDRLVLHDMIDQMYTAVVASSPSSNRGAAFPHEISTDSPSSGFYRLTFIDVRGVLRGAVLTDMVRKHASKVRNVRVHMPAEGLNEGMTVEVEVRKSRSDAPASGTPTFESACWRADGAAKMLRTRRPEWPAEDVDVLGKISSAFTNMNEYSEVIERRIERSSPATYTMVFSGMRTVSYDFLEHIFRSCPRIGTFAFECDDITTREVYIYVGPRPAQTSVPPAVRGAIPERIPDRRPTKRQKVA